MTELRNIKVTAIGSTTANGIDKSTQGLLSIPNGHHETHDGNHFNIHGFTSLNSGNTICFGVTTPNGSKWAHMTFQIEGTNQTEVRAWQGATLSGGGAVVAFNNNRNSPTASTLTVKSNPVVSGTSPTSGTLLEYSSKGLAAATPAAASFGRAIGREDEWILKSGTTYLWQIKSVGAGNIVDYKATWYEHTDKVKQF